jgi:hypothetical protein
MTLSDASASDRDADDGVNFSGGETKEFTILPVLVEAAINHFDDRRRIGAKSGRYPRQLLARPIARRRMQHDGDFEPAGERGGGFILRQQNLICRRRLLAMRPQARNRHASPHAHERQATRPRK